MTVGPAQYAVLSALVLCIGLAGVMMRRQALTQLICLGVAMTAPVIAVAGFSQTQSLPAVGANTGAALAAVLVVSATVEIGVAASVLILLVRRRHTLDLDTVEHGRG